MWKYFELFRPGSQTCCKIRDKKSCRGLTLVELLVTMIVGAIFMLIVGQLLVVSFQSSVKSAERIKAENDFMYFRRSFEYHFRSATNDPVSIVTTTQTHDTIQFASLTPTFGLVQNQFYLDNGGNLVREYWSSEYVNGALQPANPWGSAPTGTQVLLSNLNSLTFGTGSMNTNVWVQSNTQTPLNGGGSYSSTHLFSVTNWNKRL